ncbi:MAG TPA: hypothetical protein VFX02_10690 [Gammaproteobacteria bacterium]|nr:hypothetical protein [Gammaproteobacteria bacterium]
MATNPPQDLQPTSAIKNAAISVTVSFLRSRPFPRFMLCLAGASLLMVGFVAAPLWNVPLLSFVSGGEIAAICFAGGLGALGLWYLARPELKVGAAVENGKFTNRSDLVG